MMTKKEVVATALADAAAAAAIGTQVASVESLQELAGASKGSVLAGVDLAVSRGVPIERRQGPDGGYYRVEPRARRRLADVQPLTGDESSMLEGPRIDELLAVRYAEIDDDPEIGWSFDSARDTGFYGEYVLERVDECGDVLFVAGEDLADATGQRLDYHEVTPALLALVHAWHDAASTMDDNRASVRLRIQAELLRAITESPDPQVRPGEEFLDVITYCHAVGQVDDLAVTRHQAAEQGAKALAMWHDENDTDARSALNYTFIYADCAPPRG